MLRNCEVPLTLLTGWFFLNERLEIYRENYFRIGLAA